MNRSLLRLLAITLAGMLFASCATHNKYKVMDQAASEPTVPVTAIVTQMADVRTNEQYLNRLLSVIPVLGIRAGYYDDRHDDTYSGTTEPFPQLVAQGLADRLKEANVFQDVKYVATKDMPDKGQYDIVVKGTIKELRSAGGYYRWGFSIFADILWYLGVPYLDRHWEISVDYQLFDGYTDAPISEVKNIQFKTGTTFFTKYYSRGKTTDLKRKLIPVYDEFIDWFWAKQPAGNEPYWATLKTKGAEHLEALKRQEDLHKKGTPPTFAFIAPIDGSTIRSATASVQWSIAAPNGLKTAAMTVNQVPVNLGIDPLTLADADSAPRSVSAREITVPLQMGDNKLEALTVDHRGNQTRASLNLRRLPRELRPASRYVLAILADPANKAGDAGLADALTNPILGQFDAAHISIAKMDTLSSATPEAVRDFGAKPLAGNLAVILVQAKGDWTKLTIGDGVPLSDFISKLESSLATTEVVLLLDIDWSGGPGDQTLDERLDNLPARWAVLISNASGESKGYGFLPGAVVDTMKGKSGDTDRLTLERFLDGVEGHLSENGAKPAVYGRFDPSITMVERE